MSTQTLQSDVITLATWMAGDFSNWEQAITNPPFYAHIRVCIRPLPTPLIKGAEGIWLYSEQAYDYELNHPYRTAVLHLVPKSDRLEIENYRIIDAATYFGASREPERLKSLQFDQVEKLEGCNMLVHRTEHNSFKGQVESGKKCCVVRKGKTTYLNSEFEISEDKFISLDRGYDPETDERVWGSVAGAFEFEKKASFDLAAKL